MLRATRHGAVTRLDLSSPGSRAVGYAVSAWLVDPADGRGPPTLVDTGPPQAARDVLRVVAAHRPRGALVTHQHEDHAGNVAALARRGVPLAMGAATRAALAHVAPIRLYRRVTWGAMRALPADAPTFDPAPLVLVPTPGHAPDHHVVWDPERAAVFGGDLFLGVKVRIAHPEEAPAALAASLRRVAALRPRVLYDAHRGVVDDPAPLLLAKAAWIEDTIAEIARLLDAGWPEARVRAAVLGRESVSGWFSRGDYSKGSFVRAVRRERAAAAPAQPPAGSIANSRAASAS